MGFSVWQWKEKTGIRVHEKPLKRFKERLIEITGRNRSGSMEQILAEINKLINGWMAFLVLSNGMRKCESGLND